MKSVFQETKVCYLCGAWQPLHEHHIFNGRSYRDKADKDGMKVRLCVNCHEEAHTNKDKRLFLKRKGQLVWEGLYGNREDFIKRYGKSYL